MTVTPNSLAAGNLVSVKNEQFAVSAQVVDQKNVIIGTFDEVTFTSLNPNEPIQVFSAADVGGKTGYGFMLHRLAIAAFKPGNVETWIIPQLEGGSDPDQATGTIDVSASASVEAGELALYIAADRVAVSVSADDTPTEIGDAIEAAINADDNLPVTALNAAGVVTLTSKSGGPFGDDISIAVNLNPGEETPTGVVVTITDMAGGTGTPDIQDALDAMGTGDGQNEKNFTNLIHGYGQDVATLDAISTYNGLGNDFVGNYKKEIARPFRSLVGDVEAGTLGLSTAIQVGELRKETDRTNGLVCAPGEYYHPQEIAAWCAGVMAVTNTIRAEETYINKTLGPSYAAIADRWTNDYDNRDSAVKAGVSTTFAKNGVLTIQNLVTFYHPASVASESNGYRAMRNISIIQNLLFNYRANFEREKWQGISIVEDVTNVSTQIDREKVRDVDSVIDDLVALAKEFAGKAWLYNADYTISELQKGDKVTERAGLTGFDITFPVILSGEGGIYNSVIAFDTSIAVLQSGG